jgi:P27 family predicted phage terminase small subunit
MTGRPPKPTAVKIAEGNPGHRPLNTREPKPEVGAPPRPKDLSKVARKEWDRIVRLLKPTGVLARTDLAVLEMYCESYADFKDALKWVRKLGPLVKAKNGTIQHNPAIGICNTAKKITGRFASELGLTPSSRARLIVPGQGDDDDDDLGVPR